MLQCEAPPSPPHFPPKIFIIFIFIFLFYSVANYVTQIVAHVLPFLFIVARIFLLSSFTNPKCHFFFYQFHFLSFLSPQLLSPPSLFLLSIFSFSPFFTSKAVIFYTKTMIFISDSMTTISYLRSSLGLHFYIMFLVEEHTKAVIFI